MLLTKGQMLKVERRKYKDVDVPELGGQVRVASISAGCGLTLKEIAEGSKSQREMTLAMFTSCVVDENGAPVFNEAEAEAFIEKISGETLTLIITEITTLSSAKKLAAVQNGVEETPVSNPLSGSLLGSSPTA